MTACSHLNQITVLERPEPIDGCAECLASGGSWVHLEEWSWCYVDEIAFVVAAR